MGKECDPHDDACDRDACFPSVCLLPGCVVVDLAHEEDVLGGVLYDINPEGSVYFDCVWKLRKSTCTLLLVAASVPISGVKSLWSKEGGGCQERSFSESSRGTFHCLPELLLMQWS